MENNKRFFIGVLILLCTGCIILGADIMGIFCIKKYEDSKIVDVNTDLHESYEECLDYVLDRYFSPSKLKYGIHQVAIINQADDVIYQFIIVIYDDNFSFVDTWNCYSVYDSDEFMYIDCDLVED